MNSQELAQCWSTRTTTSPPYGRALGGLDNFRVSGARVNSPASWLYV